MKLDSVKSTLYVYIFQIYKSNELLINKINDNTAIKQI